MADGDDTVRQIQRLRDYNSGPRQDQQSDSPHAQHLPPVPIQRTHAGFQHQMSPPGPEHGNQHGGQGPHTPVHHHQLPPMVDPQLGGGGHQLAPIQTPPGPPSHMQPYPQTPDSAQSAADKQAGRQLNNTKRAAQNRAAQRAFRQRKEVHIKNLETKVGELEPLKRQVHSLQQDNYALRGYLITMLEQCATKGYEIPPGMPSMQNLQSGPPPPPPLESPTQDQHHHHDDAASAQLHAQQASYGDDTEMDDGQGGPGEGADGSGAPTAPMQDIAQQAMEHHGGEPGRQGPGSESGGAAAGYGQQGNGQVPDHKIDPAVTGV